MVSGVVNQVPGAKLSEEPASGVFVICAPPASVPFTQVQASCHLWKARHLYATICNRCAIHFRNQTTQGARFAHACTHGWRDRLFVSPVTRALRISRGR